MDLREQTVIGQKLYIPIPSETIILGIGYKARQGKDSAAREIIEQRGDRFDIRKYAFADELKREVEEIGISYIAFHNGIALDPFPDMSDPLCPKGKHPKVLQFWGMFRREQDPWYWVRKVASRICEDKPQIALISDMRMKNEVYFVKAAGGFTVKVSRFGFVDLTRNALHKSEIDLDDYTGWDYQISVADGQLDELKQDAVIVFDEIVQALQIPNFGVDDFTAEGMSTVRVY